MVFSEKPGNRHWPPSPRVHRDAHRCSPFEIPVHLGRSRPAYAHVEAVGLSRRENARAAFIAARWRREEPREGAARGGGRQFGSAGQPRNDSRKNGAAVVGEAKGRE